MRCDRLARMEINNCVITIKQTILERGGRAAKLARQGDVTARRIIASDDEQQRTIDAVRSTLRQHQILFTEFSATRISLE